MDLAIFHDGFLKPDDIGRLKLGDLAVFQNFGDDRCDRGQALQDIYCCGVAGLGLLGQLQRQAHLFKKEDAQLFWRIDIELFPSQLIDLLGQLLNQDFIFSLHGLKGIGLNLDACDFHLGKDIGQGQLHLKEEVQLLVLR